ncbi:hypothetical protein BDB01DRAFT_771743 [Pilobolus umbonatus]|nr:hypothetical protein BDB01DRAFT_771743 [Pilobolus umbonatus]
MRLSLTTATLFAFTLFTSIKADDSIAIAMAKFCGGLDLIAPTENDVFVAGGDVVVTATRVPNELKKTITGLDLYKVNADGKPEYVKNTWKGSYDLETKASITDTIPQDQGAGLYYFRAWITNMVDGQHGPDCIKLSRTFKVTTGSHTNESGFVSYAEALDDVNYYKPEFAKGCFGLEVREFAKDQVFRLGDHVPLYIDRDSASQTESLVKVELYQSVEGPDHSVGVVWQGQSSIQNAFILKDHLQIDKDKFTTGGYYYYKLDVTSQVKGEMCSFQSGVFKVTT